MTTSCLSLSSVAVVAGCHKGCREHYSLDGIDYYSYFDINRGKVACFIGMLDLSLQN